MPRIGRQNLELDQFYTTESTVLQCLSVLDLDDYDAVLEPCAGDGAFLRHLPDATIAMDISPGAPDIMQQDFFEYDMPDLANVLAIGNPPFGIRHSLADKFLIKCFAVPGIKTIAFILPNTYNKPTRQRIIPTNWRIKTILPLSPDSFTYKGVPRKMTCSFFVFDKSPGPDLRFNYELYSKAADFEFSDKSDFDVFVFGANPAKYTLSPTENNRGYYLKSKIPVSSLVRNFENIEWNGNSCAAGGVAWFSKHEIIKGYADFIAK